MALTPKQNLSAGRMLVRKAAPYFTHAVMSLIPKEAPGLGTMGVSKNWVLYWDPEWTAKLEPKQVMAVLIHEVSHVLRDHAGRRESMGAHPKLWNIAADCEINDDIKAMGLDLPHADSCCFPEKFGLKDGDLAESYYQELRKNAKEIKTPGQGDGGGQGDDEGEGGGGQGDGDKDGPASGQGWCGSGAGRGLPDEPVEKDGKGNVMGRSEVDAKRIIGHTAKEIQKASAKGQGSVPAGWQVWADDILQPAKVPWGKELARQVRGAVAYQAGCVDYSYSRPSRRQAAYGYGVGRPVMPTLRAPKPRVGVALDTSGSMMGDAITQALSEIGGILKAVRAEVEFLACDCEVHEVQKVRTMADLQRAAKGGGGTSFVPVFEKLDEMRNPPQILVFCTDGCGDAPAQPPKNVPHVIWVLTGSHKQVPYVHSGTKPVSWGKIIEVDDDGASEKKVA